MPPKPPTIPAMIGVFDDVLDEVALPSELPVKVGTFATEDKEVEVMSDRVAGKTTPLLVGVTKTKDVTSIVTGPWLDADVGAVWELTWFDDVEAAAPPDVGEAGEVCCKVEVGGCDVGAAWPALWLEVAEL